MRLPCYHASVNNPRFLAVGLLLALFVLTAAACGKVRQPEGWASPAVSESTAYFFADNDRLVAVDLDAARAVSDPKSTTGGSLQPLLWEFPSNDQQDEDAYHIKAVYSAPVRDGQTLYIAAYDGALFRINAPDGRGERIATQADIKGKIVAGPVLAGDLLVFGTTEGHLYAVNKDNGQLPVGWSAGGKSLGKGMWAPPVVKDDSIIVATMDGKVRSFGLDGSQRWQQPFEATGAIADLTLLNGTDLFVPTLDKKVYILDAATGVQKGKEFVAEDWVWSTPAFADNVAYFGDFSGKVYALDITTMSTKWKPYDAGTRVKASPVLIDGVLVLADRAPVVHFIDASNGTAYNTVPVEGAGTIRAGLTAAGGKAYIATTEGKLFVADPVKRSVVQIGVSEAAK